MNKNLSQIEYDNICLFCETDLSIDEISRVTGRSKGLIYKIRNGTYFPLKNKEKIARRFGLTNKQINIIIEELIKKD